MKQPNVEERLSAAAFTILTDENLHSMDAQRWAVRFLHVASRGRGTEFQRRYRAYSRSARARAFHAGVGA
jgi:hypothetical protein